MVKRVLVIACLLICGVGSTVVLNSPVQAASMKNTSSVQATKTTLPTWLKEVAPYIHFQNDTASIDPLIAQHFNTITVNEVTTAIKNFNSLSVTLRHKVVANSSAQPKVSGVHPNLWPWCPDQWSGQVYGWGTVYWINHCFVLDLSLGGGVAAIVIGLVTVGVAGVIGAVGVAYLQWVDSQCPGGGAYIILPNGQLPFAAPAC